MIRAIKAPANRLCYPCLLIVSLFIAGCSTTKAITAKSEPTAAQRVAYYQTKTADNPRHYPAWAQLSEACLDLARQTHDPRWIKEARDAAQKSLDIQDNLAAMMAMQSIENFSHHFEQAINWGRRSASVSSADTAIKAGLVESYLGLGQIDNARGVLASEPRKDFHLLAAQAQIDKAKGSVDRAVEEFTMAAQLARDQSASEHELWARVSAAGVLLDCGRVAEAEAKLDQLQLIAPKNHYLRIHLAELSAAHDNWRDALKIYESLTVENDDPFLHAQAFRAAQRVHEDILAKQHFESAERGFLKVLNAGEIYSLQALADLYLSAGQPEKARDFAQRNFMYKKDAQAQATLRRALGEVSAR